MKNLLLKFLKGEINPLLNFLVFFITYIILIIITFLFTNLNLSQNQSVIILVIGLFGVFLLLTIYISFKSLIINFKNKEKKIWDKIFSIITLLLMVSIFFITIYDIYKLFL